jgi:hypothetical protein
MTVSEAVSRRRRNGVPDALTPRQSAADQPPEWEVEVEYQSGMRNRWFEPDNRTGGLGSRPL